jgi:hypothetical protein
MLQTKRQSQHLDDNRWRWLAPKRLAPWFGRNGFGRAFDQGGVVGSRRVRNIHLVRHRRLRDGIALRKIQPKLERRSKSSQKYQQQQHRNLSNGPPRARAQRITFAVWSIASQVSIPNHSAIISPIPRWSRQAAPQNST